MRLTIVTLAAIALVSCNKAEAPADTNAADANLAADANAMTADANADVAAATNNYNESSWEYTYKGKPMLESIDASGNYITVSGKEHIDHGTAVVKGTKICFTSAMTKEGEDCWQDPKLAIGESGESVSDKGEKVTVKRVAYQALTMPAA
ncbi:MAG: hypothetical protein HOP96_05900 [Sphingomonas sp.]|jgi:hypothetical protein|nr:hypothetical protein [Sphingomonas sp.]